MAWKGESRRHSLARKGVRTAQTDPRKMIAKGKRHEFADDLTFWNNRQIKAFEKEYGEIVSVEEVGYKGYRIETEEGENLVFESYEDAWDYALNDLENMWESDSGTFPVDWVVENNIFISETDRRVIANEEIDHYVYELDDEELLEQADMEDDAQVLQDKIWENEEAIKEAEEKQEKTSSDKIFSKLDDLIDKLDEENKKLEEKIQEVVQSARDKLAEEVYEEWYEGMADPIQFFVKDHGMYSKEDLLKANFINIDYRGMAKDVLESDGVGHILSSYDGSEDEFEGAWIYTLDR